MRKIRLFIFLLLPGFTVNAQFAPQAPIAGNEGIYLADEHIAEWATGAIFERGPLDVADESLGYPTYGDATSPLGYPDGNILSLGDGGTAVVTFAHTIKNGPGADFAIFENGFANPLNDTLAYLEFAFVEVSSDGVNFSRFPATCNIQDTLQSDNFTYSDASLVNNLAGKYKIQYGTPFDLEELKDVAGLDVNNITHIRIIDVVGSIDPGHASYDKNGHIINDPYPSVYPSGGFDLDAVGVLNSGDPTSAGDPFDDISLSIYPNPATDFLYIQTNAITRINFRLTDISGRQITQGIFSGNTSISLSGYSAGLYLLHLSDSRQNRIVKINRL